VGSETAEKYIIPLFTGVKQKGGLRKKLKAVATKVLLLTAFTQYPQMLCEVFALQVLREL